MPIILVLILLFVVPQVFADEVGLIDANLPKLETNMHEDTVVEKDVVPQEQQSSTLREVDDFARQEEEKIKSIKLLSLDLEKAGIELKQREIQVKISELNKTGPLVVALSSTQASVPRRLIALTLTDDFKEAVMDVGGSSIIVHEGDSIADAKVESINAQGVIIRNADGTQESLILNI